MHSAQLLALVLLHCAALAAASGATRHVAPDGDDTNAGTASAPWRSLAYAGSQLADGDTLLLKRNRTFVDETLRSAAAGLTVGAYGAATLSLPRIQHGRTLNGKTPCASFSGADGMTVSDLHIAGCAGGLRVGSPPGAYASNVLLQRLFVNDIRTSFLTYTPPNPAWASALSFTGTFTNLTVKNCVAVRIDVFFDSTAHVVGMHLDGNTVHQCSGNCYALGSGVDLVMQNSVMLRDMSTRLFLYVQLLLLLLLVVLLVLLQPLLVLTHNAQVRHDRRDRRRAARQQPAAEQRLQRARRVPGRARRLRV